MERNEMNRQKQLMDLFAALNKKIGENNPLYQTATFWVKDVDGEDIREKGLCYHRKNNVSLVFQNYNLIDYLTPVEKWENRLILTSIMKNYHEILLSPQPRL